MQILACAILFSTAGHAFGNEPGSEELTNLPERGEVNWKGWIFRYWIDNGNEEGLVLGNVEYKGRGVLRKASLPVVRVKYRGSESDVTSGCGPFADKFYNFNIGGVFSPALSHRTVLPYPGKKDASDVVAYQRVAADGTSVLGIFIYAEIGGYRLWHGWNFTDGGQIEPLLYSSGWSCRDGVGKNDHKHHPYWRLEFAVNGARNEIWELRSAANQKPSARKLTEEQNIRRGSSEELAFVVAAANIPQHVVVQFPRSPNAEVDPPGKPWYEFSKIDAGVRLYKADEDRGWEFGAKGELGYMDVPEPIDGKDNVLWLSSHLGHVYVVGKDDEKNNHWHWTGPVLQLTDW